MRARTLNRTAAYFGNFREMRQAEHTALKLLGEVALVGGGGWWRGGGPRKPNGGLLAKMESRGLTASGAGDTTRRALRKWRTPFHEAGAPKMARRHRVELGGCLN